MVLPSFAWGSKMDPTRIKEVVIPAGTARLKAIFGLPSQAKGVVAFAHGSGSGRFSPRNNFVAQDLQEACIATLLADLLANRLLANAQWLHRLPPSVGMKRRRDRKERIANYRAIHCR